MSRETPGAGRVPVPSAIVADVAEREGVDVDELHEALAAIHEDLLDGADAIHAYYVEEVDEALSPVVAADELAAVLFLDPARWPHPADRFDYADEIRRAVVSVHAAFADALGADEGALVECVPLVVPARDVAGLVRAGLSPRQAEVQVLRRRGMTQEAMAETLGRSVGTVKSHCYRVDEKVREAERLLDLVAV